MNAFGRLLKAVNGNLPLAVRKIYTKRKSRQELLRYWVSPSDGRNRPEEYLQGRERSAFLLDLVKARLAADAAVLEIGCNVGRNLNEFFRAGFRNLSGIEISSRALELMRQAYPEMAGRIEVHNGAAEDIIGNFGDNSFDLVFTMAVLEHIHSDSEFVFSHIARVTRGLVVTVEDERGLSWRHFPRNYKDVFERFGLKQIEEVDLGRVRVPGLTGDFIARVFKK